MKLKAKISLLAGAIALMGAVYMPQANATTTFLGVIGVPGGVPIAGSTGSAGSFIDYFNFKVSETAGVGATAISWAWATQGISLDKVSLFSGASGAGSSLASVTPTSSSLGGGMTFYSGSLSYVSFAPKVWYSLKVEGTGFGNGGMYNGSIVTAPVPEPEEWAMMLVGAGLVSYQVRRKQKGLRQSVLA